MSKTMAAIEKHQISIPDDLSSEAYFMTLLQEGYAQGLLTASSVEQIQLQCLEFLAYKCRKYNRGESSSLRVETAESLMKSNVYTMGLYLKSLGDSGKAISELTTARIPEIYQKGRELITDKLAAAQAVYEQIQRNSLSTLNYTYNATISGEGLGQFFPTYQPDYEAHEVTASIDYQLCNPVDHLTGVEFIHRYLENLALENEFCGRFSAKAIHFLLCGYDSGYKDLLINIFEQVLTSALACSLVKRRVLSLSISEEEVEVLSKELIQADLPALTLKISKAAELVQEELNIAGGALGQYVVQSLPNIVVNVSQALKLNTLAKVFVSPLDPDAKPQIAFAAGVKMDDKEYRKLIDELLICRYPADKLQFIREQVRSFADLEDLLTDAWLETEEVFQVLDLLGDVEIAALIKRHPYQENQQGVYLPAAEQTLRGYLQDYLEQLAADRVKGIFQLLNQLRDEEG